MELHEVAPDFGFLFERGLKTGARSSHASCGSGDFELTGDTLSFRFTHAKGRTRVEIRSSISEWHRLSDVLSFLGTPAPEHEHGRVVEARWREIGDVFADHRRLSDLEDFIAHAASRDRPWSAPQPS